MSLDLRASAPITRDIARHPSVPVNNVGATAPDSPLSDFICDLRIVARDLENNIEEPRSTALALFKGKQLYPLCSNRTAWRGHHCAVTRDELEQAGFSDYAKLYSFGRDPFRFLALGEVPLGTIWWRHGPFYDKHDETYRPQLRRPRGVFFNRLADVLAARS
jgi:hypothetical protein